MKPLKIALMITFFALPGLVSAHHSGEHAVNLRLDSRYSECSMALDPSVTQQEFRDFGLEAGYILYFKPLAGAKPLGKFRFDIGLEQQRTSPLEDYKGKWNNTFVHPTADHYLVPDNHSLAIPLLHARMGLTDKLDLEAYATKNFGANYGFAGGAVKYALYFDANSPLAAATRMTYAALFGVADFNYHQVGLDAVLSYDIWLFRPFAGAGVTTGILAPTTAKVALQTEFIPAPVGIVGMQFVWNHLSIAAEADFGVIINKCIIV